MESTNIKCSCEEHKEIDAISFCPNCNIYMCNKCENNFHSKLFRIHTSIKLDKNDQNIFMNYCTKHNNCDFYKFFCKNHNQLVCSICLCKIKTNEYGQHADCDVCLIKDIKENKKDILKENLNFLEKESLTINEQINNIKSSLEKTMKKKKN